MHCEARARRVAVKQGAILCCVQRGLCSSGTILGVVLLSSKEREGASGPRSTSRPETVVEAYIIHEQRHRQLQLSVCFKIRTGGRSRAGPPLNEGLQACPVAFEFSPPLLVLHILLSPSPSCITEACRLNLARHLMLLRPHLPNHISQ